MTRFVLHKIKKNRRVVMLIKQGHQAKQLNKRAYAHISYSHAQTQVKATHTNLIKLSKAEMRVECALSGSDRFFDNLLAMSNPIALQAASCA